MHSIRVKYAFEASHALRDAEGLKEPKHSHLFDVEVELSSPKLDELGCVIDFREFDRRMTDVLGYLKDLDLPSTEVIAQMLFQQIEKTLSDHSAKVTALTVWEDDRHAACFRRDG
jgi:6-pyruvoyltetrahydropterin/6-carboxytetrahydropterin synthase